MSSIRFTALASMSVAFLLLMVLVILPTTIEPIERLVEKHPVVRAGSWCIELYFAEAESVCVDRFAGSLPKTPDDTG